MNISVVYDVAQCVNSMNELVSTVHLQRIDTTINAKNVSGLHNKLVGKHQEV